MRVRRAVASDSAAAAEVVRVVYDEFGFTWDADGYHADLEDVEASYAAFFVAEHDGRIVGTAGLTSHGSLERLYVLSETRGSGAGTALLTAVVQEARRRGHVQLEIWSDKRFTDAHRLYERHGARVVAERRHDDPDASHEWGLVLQLAHPRPEPT
jgi:putative acetyltransferase